MKALFFGVALLALAGCGSDDGLCESHRRARATKDGSEKAAALAEVESKFRTYLTHAKFVKMTGENPGEGPLIDCPACELRFQRMLLLDLWNDRR